MSRIGQHLLADIAARVESIKIPQSAGAQTMHRYAVCGGKLVSTRSPRGALRRIGRAIRRGRYHAACVELPLRAELGLVKNNLRFLGYRDGGRYSIKIGLPGVARSGSLCREIHTRRIIQSRINGELLPALVDYDRHRGRWLIEQEIKPDRKVTRGQMATLFLNRHAQRMYRASTRLHEIARRLPQKVSLAALRVELPVAVSDSVLTKLKWPVALCHGDLSMGNMMFDRSEQKLYLADWERGGAAPVAFDLKRLFETYPEGRTAILELLKALSAGDPAAAPAHVQMAAALACDVSLLKATRPVQLRYLIESGGLGPAAAEARFEQRLSVSRKLIGSLT